MLAGYLFLRKNSAMRIPIEKMKMQMRRAELLANIEPNDSTVHSPT